MSSTDPTDGFTKLANGLLDEILIAGFSKRELLVIFAVIRKTYGFNKKSDDMTMTQLAKITGIKLSHVSETVRDLAARSVFLFREGRYGYVLGINRHSSQWLPSQNGNLPKTGTSCSQNGNIGFPKREHHVPKTGNTKDNPKRQPQKTTPKETRTLDFSVLPPDLSSAVWQDFLAHRKAKRAPVNTQTVVKTIAAELEKARAIGWIPDAALAEAMAAGWTGVKATWLQNRVGSAGGQGSGTHGKTFEEIRANLLRGTTDEETFDGQCERLD